jgi:hypothetical protein
MPKDDSVFNTKLVEAVERNPCLYDYNLKEYNNRDIVNATWERVATEMEDTGKPCYYCTAYFTFRCSRVAYLLKLLLNLYLNTVSYKLSYQYTVIAYCRYEGAEA